MARVLVIGASKGIGLETTRQALEGGHQVRVWCDDDDEHGQFAVDIGDHEDGQRDFDLDDE